MSWESDSFGQAENISMRCIGSGFYTYAITELTVSAVLLPFHLFVVIAMVVYRDLLKRNVVNIYAGNVVFSAAVASIWRIYINAESLALIDRVSFVQNRTHGEAAEDDWHAVALGFNVVLTLVTSGSVGLIINAMRSIQFRVHKTVGGVSNLATEEPCETKEKCSSWEKIRETHKVHPKSWATFYISLIWIVPLLLTVLTAVFGECEYRCHCRGLNVPYPATPDGNCIETSINVCSDMLPPLPKLTLNVSFGVWIFYWVILTISLAKTKMDLSKIRKQRIQSMRLLSDRRDAETEKNSESTKESPNKALVVAEDETKKQEDTQDKRSVTVKLDTLRKTSTTRISGSIFIRSLVKNFKLLFVMYFSYLIGSAPLSILALIDGVNNDITISIDSPGMVIVFILPLVAELICTIMVCTYLSGIKAATRSLLIAICRCFQ